MSGRLSRALLVIAQSIATAYARLVHGGPWSVGPEHPISRAHVARETVERDEALRRAAIARALPAERLIAVSASGFHPDGDGNWPGITLEAARDWLVVEKGVAPSQLEDPHAVSTWLAYHTSASWYCPDVTAARPYFAPAGGPIRAA